MTVILIWTICDTVDLGQPQRELGASMSAMTDKIPVMTSGAFTTGYLELIPPTGTAYEEKTHDCRNANVQIPRHEPKAHENKLVSDTALNLT